MSLKCSASQERQLPLQPSDPPTINHDNIACMHDQSLYINLCLSSHLLPMPHCFMNPPFAFPQALLANYMCSCQTGFTGVHCESPIPTEPTVSTSEQQGTGEDGQSGSTYICTGKMPTHTCVPAIPILYFCGF